MTADPRPMQRPCTTQPIQTAPAALKDIAVLYESLKAISAAPVVFVRPSQHKSADGVFSLPRKRQAPVAPLKVRLQVLKPRAKKG